MAEPTALEGQTVLLTGATGAIGAAIGRTLAEQGARLLLHYAGNRTGAEALAAEIGGGALCLGADLADPAGPGDLWNRAEAAAGRIHGLVNNAGIRSEASVDADLQSWQNYWAREMQLNFTSAVDLTRAAILHFRANGGGRIVNMASRAGQRGYAGNAMAYGASKAALINLTKSVAQSFGKDGIGCVALAPGWVRTPMAEDALDDARRIEALAAIPTGAMAEPNEIGAAVAFALAPANIALSGSVIDINGASYLR